MTDEVTQSGHGANRSARWREVIAQTYFPLQLEFRDPDRFRGRLKHRACGEVALSRLTSDPVS